MNRSSGNAVDSKTVELRFDNQQFEAGAKQSLSTIERLKNVLSGTFVGKGLQGINEAANASKKAIDGMNESGSKIASAFDTIKTVAGIKMIADAAESVEKKVVSMVKAMSTDQMSAGWTKYAQKTEAVQTIMSATREQYESQEAALEDINAQLEKLNWFSDETSANFTDMVDNIGKFTANQVALDKAAVAMEGVFNWASTAGQTATEAGRAMYNLSQAIGVGSVKLIDWRSIQNANMATAEFKKMVIETAEEMGTLTKTADGMWKTVGKGTEVSVRNFESALSEGWFSSEVLVDVLNKYGVFTERLYSYMNEMDYDSATDVLNAIHAYQDGTIDWAEAVDEAGVSLSRLKEILADLSSDELEFSRNAFEMSQQAITFKQAMDATSDAASTAWMNIFETIFGDYLQAKGTWTKLSEMLYDVFVTPINDAGDAIKDGFSGSNIATVEDFNKIVDAGLANPKYIANLRKAGEESGFFMDRFTSDMEYVMTALRNGELSTRDLTDAFNDLGSGTKLTAENVDENLKKRLEEGGEDIQTFLDQIKELDKTASAEDIMGIIFGNGVYDNEAKDLEAAMDGLLKSLGLSQEQGDVLRDTLIDMGVLTDDYTRSLTDLSFAELRQLGYTKEQAAMIRSMAHEGKSLDEIMSSIGIDGRTGADHWSKGLDNLMSAVGAFQEVAGEEWSNVFPDIEGGDIFDLLKAFDSGTEGLLDYIENSETLRTVFHTIAEAVSLVVQNLRLFASGLGGIALANGAGLLLKLVGGFTKLTGVLLKAALPFEFIRGFFEGFTTNADGTTNAIGKIVSGFIEFLKVLDPINKLLGLFRNLGRMAGLAFGGFITKVMNSEKAQKAIAGLKKNWDTFYTGFSKHMNDGKGRVEKFMMNLDRMGGLRLDNFGEVFKMAKDELVDWIMTFPGVKEGVENLKKIWSSFEDALREAGIPVDDIKEEFSNLGSTVKTAFGWIKDMALDAWSFLQDKWDTFINLPVVQNNIQRFKDAFATVKDTFLPWIDRIKAGWDVFVADIEEMGGFKFENLGKIWESFSENVLDNILSWEGFDAIKDAFSHLWEDIKKGIKDTTGFDIDGAWEGVKSFFEELRGILKDIGLPTSLDEIPGFIEDVGDAINNMKTDKSGTAAQVFGVLQTVFEAIYNVIKYVVDHWKIFAAIGLVLIFLKKLDMIVADVRKRFQATTKNIEATAKLKTAAAFALVVVAIGWLVKTFIKLAREVGSGWDAIKSIGPPLAAIVVLMYAISKTFESIGKNKVTAGEITGLALVVGAIAALAVVFALIGNISWGHFAKATASLAVITGCIAGLMAMMIVVKKFGGEKAAKYFGKAFKGIAAAIAAIAAALLVMALIPSDKLLMVSIILGALLVIVGIIMALAGGFKVTAGPFIAMAVVIAAIGVVIGLLNAFVGAENVKDIATGLGIAFAGLAALMWSLSKLAVLPFTAVLAAIGEVVLVLVALAAIGWAVGALDEAFGIGDTMENGINRICNILDRIVASIIKAIGNLIKTTRSALGMDRPLLQMLADDIKYISETLGTDEFKEGIEKIASIDMPLSLINNLATLAIVGIVGSLVGLVDGLTSLVTVPLLNKTAMQTVADDTAYLVGVFGTESFKNNVEAIGAIDISADVGANLLALGLVDVLASVVGLINGIASIPSKLEFDKSAIQLVVDDLKYMAETFGSPEFKQNIESIGNVKFSSKVQSNLQNFASTDLMMSLSGFVSGISSILPKLMFNRSAVEQVITDLTEIADAFSNEEFQSKMEQIGQMKWSKETQHNLEHISDTDLMMSLTGMVSGFASLVSEWSEGLSAVELVIRDTQQIADAFSDGKFQQNMQKIGSVDITDAVANINKLTGTDFCAALAGLTSGFASIFSEMTEDVSAVELVIRDVKKMADAFSKDDFQSKINSIGNITVPVDKIQELTQAVNSASLQGLTDAFRNWVNPQKGDGDVMTNFIVNVALLAEAVKSWVNSMKDIEHEDFTVPEEQINQLVRSINAVTNSGGLFGKIREFLMGKDDLDQFKTDAGLLGEAVNAFVTGLDGLDMGILTRATAAAANLASLAQNMQGVSMTINEWVGSFSTAMGSIGQGFRNIVTELGENPQQAIDAATAFGPIIEALATTEDINLEGDIMDTTKVGEFVAHIDAVKEAIESLKDMDTSGTYKLKGALTTISSVDVSGASDAASKMKDKIASSGSEASSGLADSLGSSEAKTKASGAVSGLMDAAAGAIDTARFAQKGTLVAAAITEGLVNGTKYVVTAVSAMMSEASGAISTSEFMTAGNNAADGFASGITLRAYVAVQAAAAMARLAVQAVKNTIQSASPSKVTRELGGFFTEGFAIGVSDRVDDAVRASNSMAAAVTEGLKTTIGTINTMIEEGIDTQPVIRPVLDLGEIQNGAVGIGELLSQAAPIGMYDAFGSVMSDVEARRRASSIDDVVSALSAIERNGANASGDTYNVNGITYDDGSNVADAVRTLVRATKVGRRS